MPKCEDQLGLTKSIGEGCFLNDVGFQVFEPRLEKTVIRTFRRINFSERMLGQSIKSHV